jgi:hypothetical protein
MSHLVSMLLHIINNNEMINKNKLVLWKLSPIWITFNAIWFQIQFNWIQILKLNPNTLNGIQIQINWCTTYHNMFITPIIPSYGVRKKKLWKNIFPFHLKYIPNQNLLDSIFVWTKNISKFFGL